MYALGCTLSHGFISVYRGSLRVLALCLFLSHSRSRARQALSLSLAPTGTEEPRQKALVPWPIAYGRKKVSRPNSSRRHQHNKDRSTIDDESVQDTRSDSEIEFRAHFTLLFGYTCLPHDHDSSWCWWAIAQQHVWNDRARDGKSIVYAASDRVLVLVRDESTQVSERRRNGKECRVQSVKLRRNWHEMANLLRVCGFLLREQIPVLQKCPGNSALVLIS